MIFGDTKNDPFWTRIYKAEFSVIQKKWTKKWISPRKIGLQLSINTHSVNTFVAHNMKIKYFRVAFEWRILFDQKLLKFDIKFTRDFMKKTFSKFTQIDSELKTEPKIFNTLVQLTMHFCEQLNIQGFFWIFLNFFFHLNTFLDWSSVTCAYLIIQFYMVIVKIGACPHFNR